MNKSDLLRELRARTLAGMKDCNDALREANDDLEKAVDIIKTKGQNIVSGREGKVASEGMVSVVVMNDQMIAMTEVNCQTDFVANSPAFQDFSRKTCVELLRRTIAGDVFCMNDLEEDRKELIASTKENVVIRRWWVEQTFDVKARVFSYVHSNNKVATLISMLAPTEQAATDPDFIALGSDLAMQVTAMSPLAISTDHLDPEIVQRQQAIFETQLQELNKPPATWEKIIKGKFAKWSTEVCLLDQESVIVPKTTVRQVIKNVGAKLGGEVQIINFIRCQVGEGIEVKKEDYLAEVAKLQVIND
jgi:elongation factor Ts